MKTIASFHALLFAIAAASLSLPICGCGGSSTATHSGPTPDYDALFAPYLGTYSVVQTLNPTNASGDFTLTLAMGKGSFYGSSVPVVTETTAEPQNVFNGEYARYWSEGKAYLKDAELSADGTQITQLNFVFARAYDPKNFKLSMSVAPTATSGVMTGNVGSETDEPPVGEGYVLTLTRQSQ